MTLANIARTLEEAVARATTAQVSLATAALRLSCTDAPQSAEVARSVGWEAACAAECLHGVARRLGRFRDELEAQLDLIARDVARLHRQLEKDQRLGLDAGAIDRALLDEAQDHLERCIGFVRAARAATEGL